VIKLTLAPEDPIPGRVAPPPPPPELVDGEEEYLVEEVINSRMFRRRLQYLVKWEGYNVEHNTWEYAENLDNAQDVIAEFHTKNPAAPRRIRTMVFNSIPFKSISLPTATSGRCLSRGGVIVRGTPFSPTTSQVLPYPAPMSTPISSLIPITSPVPPMAPLHVPLTLDHH